MNCTEVVVHKSKCAHHLATQYIETMHYCCFLAQILWLRQILHSAVLWTAMASSADKSAGEENTVIVYYNVGWQLSRFNQIKKHEKTLRADLQDAIEKMEADVILLCECGEIEQGLPQKEWLEMVRACNVVCVRALARAPFTATLFFR